jgi:hypothetical protein
VAAAVAEMKATAPVIEIIEHVGKPSAIGVIVPNDVRINGQSLLVSADDPVVVHEISLTNRETVRVTLTLFARRVVISEEVDGAGG